MAKNTFLAPFMITVWPLIDPKTILKCIPPPRHCNFCLFIVPPEQYTRLVFMWFVYFEASHPICLVFYLFSHSWPFLFFWNFLKNPPNPRFLLSKGNLTQNAWIPQNERVAKRGRFFPPTLADHILNRVCTHGSDLAFMLYFGNVVWGNNFCFFPVFFKKMANNHS